MKRGWAYLAAGVVGGALAGLGDALGGLGGLAARDAALVLAGNAGLHALLGAALAPLAAAAAAWGPGVGSLARAAHRRLWPRDGEGLYERCHTAATIGVATLVGGGLFAALAAAYGRLLARVHSGFFRAAAVTLVAVVATTLALGLGVALRAGLARALEVVVRRWPRWTPLSHPMVALFGCVAAVLTGVLVGTRHEPAWSALDLRPFVTGALLVAALSVGTAALRRRRAAGALGLAAAVALGGSGALAVGLAAPGPSRALGERTGLGRLVLRGLRAPFDRDRDGYAAVLGGGDCDDGAPGVHPGAVDVPGNGVDEDCDGVDAPAAPPAGAAPTRRAAPRPHNLVLVTLGALGPDALGGEGDERSATPALDALAREAVTFLDAHSPSAAMPDVIPAILSGRYPSELHRTAEALARFSAGNTFVAEVLAERGYRTAGFPSHGYLDAAYGLAQGFETWPPVAAPPPRGPRGSTARPVVEAALAWLEGVPARDGRPWFLWAPVFDPPGAGVERAAPAGRADAEVRQVDRWIGELLAGLRARADWERTVVVVTAVHGAAGGEPDDPLPGAGLRQRRLRVPLLVRVPGVAPREVAQRVGLVDLAPTLLDLAAMPAEATQRVALGLRGESWWPLLRGEARPERPVYAEVPSGPERVPQAALLLGDLKLRHDAAGDAYALFDLGRDPDERHDLLRLRPREAWEMTETLRRYRATMDVRPPTP